MASEFRCRVTACDISGENIELCPSACGRTECKPSYRFKTLDLLSDTLPENSFDLVLAEGGVLSFISVRKGLSLASSLLTSRGWMAFSDLILLSDKVPMRY